MGVHNLAETKGPVTYDKCRSPSSSSLSASRFIGSSMRPWKSRSKSQTRVPLESKSNWTMEGLCRWRNSSGQLVVLKDTSLLGVSEVERLALQRLAVTRLQGMNLGCPIDVPKSENFAVEQQTKKRTMLLRKKAVTTNFFESKEKDRCSSHCSAVFGVPLSQCILNDRLKVSTDGRNKPKEQKNHCEEVLSALRIASRPTYGEVTSQGVMQQSFSPRGSLPDVNFGELQIPLVVQACIRFLEDKGLQTLGIFRVSGSQKRVRQLREDWDKNRTSPFDCSTQPHDVAQLLKEYFRDLPEPLLTRTLYRAFLSTQRITNTERILNATRWLLYLLPVAHRDTLATLLAFLQNVSSFADDFQKNDGTWATGNKMDSNNLATVFGPNLLRMSRGSSDSPYTVHSVERAQERSDIILTVRTLIENGNQLFQVPADDLDAVYQLLMAEDPELLNAMLCKQIDNQRKEEYSEGSSSRCNSSYYRRNINLQNIHEVSPKQASCFNEKEFLEDAPSDWNVRSGIRPLIMVKETDKPIGKQRNQSSERIVEDWRLEDRRASGGSVKEQHLHPCSVTASFTITMATKGLPGVAGILPHSSYAGNTVQQDQQLPKPRRVPYGKLRHMTTPAYYTEETITTVTIPSPRNIPGSPGAYKSSTYEAGRSWDATKNRSGFESPKSTLSESPRSRGLDHISRTNQPVATERWKRQEIIASEHIQI